MIDAKFARGLSEKGIEKRNQQKSLDAAAKLKTELINKANHEALLQRLQHDFGVDMSELITAAADKGEYKAHMPVYYEQGKIFNRTDEGVALLAAIEDWEKSGHHITVQQGHSTKRGKNMNVVTASWYEGAQNGLS